MRSFRHPRWQHLDYRVKVATTQENKPPTQGTRQWTFTTPRWRCGSILLPSLNAGVPEPTGGLSQWDISLHCKVVFHWLSLYPELCLLLSCSHMHESKSKHQNEGNVGESRRQLRINQLVVINMPQFWLEITATLTALPNSHNTGQPCQIDDWVAPVNQ